MTAKDYLRQIQVLNTMINQKIEEKESLRSLAMGLSSPVSDPNKVQTSISGDTMSDAVFRYVDLERKITVMIDRYVDVRDKIIEQIHSLDCGDNKDKYINILYKRYVEQKSFEKIAVEMNYEYKWICRLHGYALKEFQRQILKP